MSRALIVGLFTVRRSPSSVDMDIRGGLVRFGPVRVDDFLRCDGSAFVRHNGRQPVEAGRRTCFK